MQRMHSKELSTQDACMQHSNPECSASDAMHAGGTDWREGQPPNWRTDNEWMPLSGEVASGLNQSYPYLTEPHLPRECRCVVTYCS